MATDWTITFESGDFSEFDTEDFDGYIKAVTAAAAIDGSYGLEYSPNSNDINQGAGQITTGTAVGDAIKFGFKMDLNDVDMDNWTISNVRVITLMGLAFSDTGLNLTLSKVSDEFYLGIYYDDNGSVTGAASSALPAGGTPFEVEFVLTKATSDVADDGTLKMYLDGELDVSVTDISNRSYWDNLKYFDLLLEEGGGTTDSDLTGSLYLDSFSFDNDYSVPSPPPDDLAEIPAAVTGSYIYVTQWSSGTIYLRQYNWSGTLLNSYDLGDATEEEYLAHTWYAFPVAGKDENIYIAGRFIDPTDESTVTHLAKFLGGSFSAIETGWGNDHCGALVVRVVGLQEWFYAVRDVAGGGCRAYSCTEGGQPELVAGGYLPWSAWINRGALRFFIQGAWRVLVAGSAADSPEVAYSPAPFTTWTDITDDLDQTYEIRTIIVEGLGS